MSKDERNARCRCGSGRKYKNCCLRNTYRERFPLRRTPSGDADALGGKLAVGPQNSRKPLVRVELVYAFENPLGKAEVNYCYPCGTQIIMADGNVLSVEHVCAGMHFRLENGGIARVSAADIPRTWELLTLVRDNHGNVEQRIVGRVKYTGYYPRIDLGTRGDTIGTTPGHLFWSETRRTWAPAETFRPGELLRLESNLPVVVDWVSPVRLEFCELYNVELEEHHNYFASGGASIVVWAHNGIGDGCGVPKAAVAEALETGAVRNTSRGRAGMTKPPDHHIFPQAFRDWFTRMGVNIEQFKVRLTQGVHEALHYKMPGETGGGFWNNEIMARIRSESTRLGRDLTRREILRIGNQMRNDFLGGVKLSRPGSS